jgi:HAMP domain-containing protein
VGSARGSLAGSTIRGGGVPAQDKIRDDRRAANADRPGPRRALLGGISLVTRIFLVKAAVLAAAVVALALSPVTVSDPVALHEAVVLVAGLSLLLIVNLALFRRTFAPLAHLTHLMRTVDPLQPGRRIPVYSDDAEVAELTLAFNEMLDRLEEERRQSTRRSLSAQEAERRRVAQELHDQIGQSLVDFITQKPLPCRRYSAPQFAHICLARHPGESSRFAALQLQVDPDNEYPATRPIEIHAKTSTGPTNPTALKRTKAIRGARG